MIKVNISVNHGNESSLFEVSLICTLDKGEVGTYPKIDPQLLSDDLK